MNGWKWLTEFPYNWGFIIRVLLKAAALFALLNVAFALLDPLPSLGQISLYNLFWKGRERLPYGENPTESYNLALNDLNAMFASHAVSSGKSDDEYRVFLIGDSSTWGFLLESDQTLAGYLNAGDYQTEDGRELRVFNIGYPTMSLTKDLMMLDKAMEYQPDLVVWLVTLESFPRSKQLESAIVKNNPETASDLIERYNLDLSIEADDLEFWEQTMYGQRRPLSDWLRLQVYGMAWTVTGIDQSIPETYDLRQSDFEEDISWYGRTEPPLDEEFVVWDVLQAGAERVGDTPFLLINEPIFISDGENSDLRYNFWYPRWAYDEYRERLAEMAEAENWRYVDLWDVIAPEEFTDSPVHLTPAGSHTLSEQVAEAILEVAQGTP
jgi:hypothetical protein